MGHIVHPVPDGCGRGPTTSAHAAIWVTQRRVAFVGRARAGVHERAALWRVKLPSRLFVPARRAVDSLRSPVDNSQLTVPGPVGVVVYKPGLLACGLSSDARGLSVACAISGGLYANNRLIIPVATLWLSAPPLGCPGLADWVDIKARCLPGTSAVLVARARTVPRLAGGRGGTPAPGSGRHLSHQAASRVAAGARITWVTSSANAIANRMRGLGPSPTVRGLGSPGGRQKN